MVTSELRIGNHLVPSVDVLLVDDDPQFLYMLSRHLHEEGLTVETASDLHRVFALWESLKPRVVVLDVNLNNVYMDGWNLCSYIRGWDDLIRIVVITGRPELGAEDGKLKALKLGANDYLQKPNSPQLLVEVIKNEVGTSRILERAGGSSGRQTPGAPKVVLHDAENVVYLDGERVDLTPKEVDILRLLLTGGRMLVRYEELADRLYSGHGSMDRNNVKQLLKRLRSKLRERSLEDPFDIAHGVGVRIAAGWQVSPRADEDGC